MSLSDEERYNGLLWATKRLVEYGKNTKVEQYTSQLWHSFLGMIHNGCHWVMGSPSSNQIENDDANLWASSILHYIKDETKEESEFLKSRRKKDYEEPFDAFKHIFCIESLIREKCSFDPETNEEHADIYQVYQWTEQATYYLRRYEDKFSKQYESYNKLISDIQGECFNYFTECNCYTRAYIVNQIMKLIYGNEYPYRKEKWNELTKWLDNDSVHHDLNRCMEMNIIELKDIHISLVKDTSMKNQVINLGKLLVRRLHKYKDNAFLKKYISQEMFKKAKKMYEDHEKYTPLDPLSIYKKY